MTVLPAPPSATHDLGGTRFTSLATPSRGSTETAVWQVEIDAEVPATPHSLTREEVFVVLEGTASVRLDGEVSSARPGDAIVVPAGVALELSNPGDGPLRMLCCLPVGGEAQLDDGSSFDTTLGGMTDAPDPQVPIARLLAMAYRHQMDELHERLRAAGWTDVRPAYGFVLLAARDRPTTATELGVLMGTTKQAASKLIDSMQAARYVRRTTSEADGRQRSVVLAARGRKLLTVVEGIYRDLEDEWAAVVGAGGVERLRRDLSAVLTDSHEGRLPPVRPTW